MKDIKNYPAPTGYYKVDVINGCDWKSSCSLRLGISVGGKHHEGDRLFALAEWAAARFETVTVLVADSLQRHNIMLHENIGETEAMTRALAAGEEWIAKNSKTIEMLPHCKIVRFEELKQEKSYLPTLRLLHDLLESDETFRNLIERDIRSVWTRKANAEEAPPFDFDQFFIHSKNYILEELAVMNSFDTAYPGVEVYPGSFLQVLTSPERFRVKGLPDRLLHFPLIEVDFTRNRGYTPSKNLLCS